MPNEFSLSFPVISKMVFKTILSISLKNAVPAYNTVSASNVNCMAFLAVQPISMAKENPEFLSSSFSNHTHN